MMRLAASRPQSFRASAAALSVAAACLLSAMLAGAGFAVAAQLPDTVEKIKPAIVGIGTYQQTRSPRTRFLGTGFVVADGRHVITNEHVVPEVLDTQRREFIAVIIAGPRGRENEVRRAERIAVDKAHDLALLRIDGDPLPALKLGTADTVREGQAVAFIGFPIGSTLGLVPATHRGTIAAITPIALPARSARDISPAAARQLRDVFDIYQLDATSYPGNSGSPLFDPASGAVLGVLNMVFVKSAKESALERPSGISYAIPVQYVKDLLRQAQLPQP